jgi:hypothetical protein
MTWKDKQRAWAWRQLRIVRAVSMKAMRRSANSTVDPNVVLDTIVEIGTFNARAPEMDKQLTNWEREHVGIL